jgi:hypothetical protein
MTGVVPPDDRISAYLDGELPAAEHYMVLQLLVESPEWRKELDEVSWARVSVRVLPARVAPTGFFEALLEDGLHERGVRAEAKRRGRSPRRSRRTEVQPVAPAAFVDEPDAPSTVEDMPFAAGAEPADDASAPADGPPAPPSPFDRLVPEEPEMWDRPAPPAGPPVRRQTRQEIVAAKDALRRPAPVRRDPDDATTPFGKPPPRRRPLRAASPPPAPAVPTPAVSPPAPAVPTPAVSPAVPTAGAGATVLPAPPVDADEAELRSLDAARKARSRRVLRWAAGAAAAAAVVVAAVLVPAKGSVTPAVPEFAGAHSVRSSVSDDPVMQLATVGTPTFFGR